MHFKDFVKMVREAIATSNKVIAKEQLNARALTTFEYLTQTGGVQCSVYLKADGTVSETVTALKVDFIVMPD